MTDMVLKAPRSERSPVLRPLAFALPAVAALAVLAFISLLVGVSDVSVATIVRLFSHNEDDLATQVLVASRVPRSSLMDTMAVFSVISCRIVRFASGVSVVTPVLVTSSR